MRVRHLVALLKLHGKMNDATPELGSMRRRRKK